MPPSPAMRISPQRELRAENHKRGSSFESGILFREKDDDLALFNEVQNKERENFLLQSNDDFDNIFSTKLRFFSGNKLGISIPARRESSDLLNAEGDKNDYDWLITPPETPLFPSLDDEAPTVSLAPRGRPRSQPITISRSPTMEKGYRSARSSASPHRPSPPPSLRHSSPSRRPSRSPSKPTPAPPRTSTPTPRRMSTGSAGPSAQSRARAPSPVKTSCMNLESPKIKAWQSNIPGFSSEAPPNLRTSLADRPASYVRGSSPASRNGFRSGRQSMSPTASRSVGSFHSHERDQFSSHSKDSVASSGDDDVDSLQSNPVSGNRSVPRSVGASPNNRAVGFSKKANKVLSSAPKRSFDLAIRQMERKGPQNMFRPLLSSVPSSTLYAGKEIAHHRPLISRNSSIATSSNASSDQGTNGGALDTEEIEQNHEHMTSGFEKGQSPTEYDEIFVMDQADASNEAVEGRIIEESPHCQHGENDKPFTIISQLGDRESDANGILDMEFCSKCSRSFNSSKLIREGDMWLCLECRSTKINSSTIIPVSSVIVYINTTGDSVQILEESGPLDVLDPSASVPETSVTSAGQTVEDHLDSSENLAILSTEDRELNFSTQQEINHSVVDVSSNTMVDVSEGTGALLLLKRMNSVKGHIVQSSSFTENTVSYDDFSYTRDCLNSTRSSIGLSSASTSSSVDLGSSRQTNTRFNRQSSDRKSDIENYTYETSVKHRRSISSLSGGASGLVYPTTTPSCLGDSFEVASVNKDKEIGGVTSECTDGESISADMESSMIIKTAAGLSSLLINVYSRDTSVASTSEEIASDENGENLTNISSNSIIEETSAEISTKGDDAMQSSCPDRMDVAGVPQTSSLNGRSEIEIEKADIVSPGVDSTTSKSCTNELMERSVSLARNDVMTNAIEEFYVSVPNSDALEESTVLLQDLGGTKPRSLTLEEDAILFCSSIVHNLAYEGVNIAIGKENSQVELLRPTITLVGKSNSDRRDIRSRTISRRSSRSQKAKQRKLETDTKPPVVAETDEKPTQCIVKSPSKGDSMNPPKLESKCNCTIM